MSYDITLFKNINQSLKNKYPCTEGKTYEFVKGNFSLFITTFEDGRGYAEIFRCTPQQEQQRCTAKELKEIVNAFNLMDL